MNQITVPQFIDVEDKIIGSITARQFIIILVGFIFDAICYRLFDFAAFLTATVVNMFLFGIFAFAKINGRPFHHFVLNIFQTFKKSRLRVWNHYQSKTGLEEEEIMIIETKQALPVKNFSSSRLAELALVVDTQGAYRGEIKSDKTRIRVINDTEIYPS